MFGSLRKAPPVLTGGYRVFEEDGLGPYPPAVCGRRVGVFSFDGSTAVYLRLRAAAKRRLPPAHACGRSLFASGKKKVTVEPSKEKTLSRRPRAAGGYGSKPFCPQTLQPLREHGRGA